MSPFDKAMVAALVMLSLSIMLTFVRLVKGPTLPDRVIAFDLIASITIGMIAIYSIVTGTDSYLDAAMILSLIAFLGAVAFAYYMKNKLKQK